MSSPADRLFSGTPEVGRTDALVVARSGEIVLERYGDGVDSTTRLRSWSMAKSVLHAAVGLLVADGTLDLDIPAPVAAWSGPGDPRGTITLGNLMTMRAGLAWSEEPDEAGLPDVVTMLFGDDRRPLPDTAAWAADRSLVHEPGSHFHYSSGTSAIVSGIVRDLVGPGQQYEQWLDAELFEPIGMDSPRLRFDTAGTWLASSYCGCTARDLVRFGQLYLDGGRVDGHQLLPARWVDTAGVETGRDELGRIHTMHWWRLGDDPWGAFQASGYLGQHLVVVPPLDLVILRTGETPTGQRHHVAEALVDMIAEFDVITDLDD